MCVFFVYILSCLFFVHISPYIKYYKFSYYSQNFLLYSKYIGINIMYLLFGSMTDRTYCCTILKYAQHKHTIYNNI